MSIRFTQKALMAVMAFFCIKALLQLLFEFVFNLTLFKKLKISKA